MSSDIKEIKIPKKETWGYNTDEVFKFFAETNRPEYNLLKLGEELAELQEVVLKTHLKIPEKRPPIEKMIEEVGDVVFRLGVLIKQYDIQDKIGERIDFKVGKFLSFFEEGKYKGGI